MSQVVIEAETAEDASAARQETSKPARLLRAALGEIVVSLAFLIGASGLFFAIIDAGFLARSGLLPSDGSLPGRYLDWQLDALAGEYGDASTGEPVAPIVQDFLDDVPRVGLMFALIVVIGGWLGTRIVDRGNFRISAVVVAGTVLACLTVREITLFVVRHEWLGLALIVGVAFVAPMAKMTHDRLRSTDGGSWLRLSAVLESGSWLVGPYLSLLVLIADYLSLVELPLWQRWLWVDKTTVLALGWWCIVINVVAWRLLRFLGHSARLVARAEAEPRPECGDLDAEHNRTGGVARL